MFKFPVVSLSFLLVLFVPLRSVSAQTLAEKLGYKPTDRLLIVNNDDAGMCHSANLATIEGQEKGSITSATIMAPCPWVSEIAEYAKNNPEKDFGVHLTHTSEWKYYRWGTVASKEDVKGLLAKDGFMHRNVLAVYSNATVDEALIEGRAQIQKLIDAGVPITHIDSHMGTMQLAENFVPVHGVLSYLPAFIGSKFGGESPCNTE